jgi:hypothetical protein
MRYLDAAFIESALHRGKAVSQWLPPRSEGDQTILRWVNLEPSGDGVSVRYCEVFDSLEMETYDIGQFPAVNPDEPHGMTEEYPTLDAALDAARMKCGARDDRYVNESMIDSEYELYRRENRLNARPPS